MRSISAFVTFALFSALIPASAIAADFGSTNYRGSHRSATCVYIHRSAILDLPTVDAMRAEVGRRYEHALDVSYAHSTIYSRSPRFVWAVETKAACGKAIGFFKGREINDEMISKCDCYYSRMVQYTRQ